MTGRTTLINQHDATLHHGDIGKQGTTSNGEIAGAARNLLQNSPYGGSLRTASCSEHEGVLVLHGRVHTYHQKQRAQEAVRHIPGVHCIINSIEVDSRLH
ncbi:MAG: BON domain-containing protein [Planctomycetaceae bacterium]